jgi:hypothetical protein
LGLTRSAAVRGIIPPGNKISELRDNLVRLMSTTAVVMDERFGETGLEAVSEVFRRLGKEDAKAIKQRLGLGNTLKDALDAWIVIGHVMGAHMEAKWISDERVETNHPFCPQYRAFVKSGKLYCEAVCLPYVEGVAVGIADNLRMEVTKPADMTSACTKALVIGKEEM